MNVHLRVCFFVFILLLFSFSFFFLVRFWLRRIPALCTLYQTDRCTNYECSRSTRAGFSSFINEIDSFGPGSRCQHTSYMSCR